jgi:hypothetical protein
LARRLGAVQPDSNLGRETVSATVVGKLPLDSDGAVDRRCRFRKGDEEAVSGLVDLLTLMAGEERSQRFVVPADEIRPRVVSDRVDEFRLAHDVREHEGLRLTTVAPCARYRLYA